ncbi:Opioid-binding protein/cell adhesion molecule [Acropora cervicornis]|uniref:Opioid-binding protein/cell adhesion molecule n=1 Tax=Acropora cervicornis TaxID=6130 RepID=A0AAD9QNV9_ACRCE|nr:Opioid-binding protein/cell adhesion molecule [Acropora cervicornis]
MYRSNMLSLCETSNSLLFKNRAASLVLLTVTLVLFLQATAFTWTKKPPNPIFGILGKNVTLEWNFTLNSARVLDYFVLEKRTVNDKWLKKVVKYDETGILFFESFVKSVVILQNGTTSFMLLNLTKEDEGLYCCDVTTKASGGGKNGENYRECTQLTILVSPTIAAISPDQTINETDDVTLSCQAKGIPSPTITWLKADDEKRNLSSSSELSLKNINRDQDAPPLIDYVSNNATVNETGSIILFCNTTANPQLNITWDFLSGPNPMNLAKGTTLTLANVNRNQAGTYRCKAENGAKANATANIHVTVNCE